MKRFGIWAMLVLVSLVSGSICRDISAQEEYDISTIEYCNILNLAGRQRMLTQKMSKEILLIAWNVDADKNREELKRSAATFERTLDGLIKGDKELGLPVANNHIAEHINSVRPLWMDFKAVVVEAATSGQTSEGIIKKVSDINLPLLDKCDEIVMVYEVEAEHITGGGAHIINLTGKQRMLTQKMAKEFLLITLNVNPYENKLRLQHTAHLFEQTLNGLIKGGRHLKLQRTTSKVILKQLSKVQALWKDFKEPIDTALNTGKWSQDSIKKIADLNMPLLTEMHKAVSMYEEEYHPELTVERDAWLTY
ncbi:MAG: type IV pili methyl-accepting chemotaxis transducer N-terminal domain-containing protein [Candidatus Brocadiales bacterium]